MHSARLRCLSALFCCFAVVYPSVQSSGRLHVLFVLVFNIIYCQYRQKQNMCHLNSCTCIIAKRFIVVRTQWEVSRSDFIQLMIILRVQATKILMDSRHFDVIILQARLSAIMFEVITFSSLIQSFWKGIYHRMRKIYFFVDWTWRVLLHPTHNLHKGVNYLTNFIFTLQVFFARRESSTLTTCKCSLMM